MFIAAFCESKVLEIEGMLIDWEMAEQAGVYEWSGILLCYESDE